MPKTLKYIVYQSAKEGERAITLIEGYALYQSTGLNSGFPGTWFPLLGIADKGSADVFYKQQAHVFGEGYVIKPKIAKRDIPSDVENKGIELGLNEDFFYRMGNLECLLLSSLINEGYWATPEGLEYKRLLEIKYPDFYSAHQKVSFQEGPVQIFSVDEPSKVNAWLTESEPLKEIMPKTNQENVTVDEKRRLFALRRKKPKNVISMSENEETSPTTTTTRTPKNK